MDKNKPYSGGKMIRKPIAEKKAERDRDFNVVVRFEEFKLHNLNAILAHRIAGMINYLVENLQEYYGDNPEIYLQIEKLIKQGKLKKEYLREDFLKKEQYEALLNLIREWETGRGKRNFRRDGKIFEAVLAFDRKLSLQEIKEELELFLKEFSKQTGVVLDTAEWMLGNERKKLLLNKVLEFASGKIDGSQLILAGLPILLGISPERNFLPFIHEKNGKTHLHILIIPRGEDEKKIKLTEKAVNQARINYLPPHVVERMLRTPPRGKYSLKVIHLLRSKVGKKKADRIVSLCRQAGIKKQLFHKLVLENRVDELLQLAEKILKLQSLPEPERKTKPRRSL